MIKFENVTATYKKNVGIFNISFDVAPGELVFIMGPTGSGKSTVLKTIYKDMNINSGKIFIDNIDSGEAYITESPFVVHIPEDNPIGEESFIVHIMAMGPNGEDFYAQFDF